MKWGMDIVGKLPTTPGQRVYMLAVTDYFTKWVQAEAYHHVCDREAKNFIWKNVICRFGVPKEIVIDNSSQFISFDFQDFCKEWGDPTLLFYSPLSPSQWASGVDEQDCNQHHQEATRESQGSMGR